MLTYLNTADMKVLWSKQNFASNLDSLTFNVWSYDKYPNVICTYWVN